MPFVSSVRGSYGAQARRRQSLNFQNITGGTITTSGGYRIHTFTSTGNSTFDMSVLPDGQVTSVEYLVVAGGGGGGAGYYTGAGGAGGMRTGTLSTPATSYTITVGDGGVGGGRDSTGPSAANGLPSTFSSITSTGGGRGGGSSAWGGTPGQPGGSGGGGQGVPSGIPAGSGTPGQGNNGGSGGASWCGGGGGGAGGAGGAGSPSGGAGGSGSSSSISGTSSTYAAGGHGNRHQQSGYSPRPSGVGGAGVLNCCNVAHDQTLSNAVQSTGSGGGGHDVRNPGFGRAGDGANGVVILRYLI